MLRHARGARHRPRDAPVDGPQVGAAAGADKHAVLEVLAAEAIRISAALRLGVGVAGEGSGGVVQQMCGGGAIAAAAALRLPCTQAARRLLGPEGRVLVLACSCMLLVRPSQPPTSRSRSLHAYGGSQRGRV